MRDPERIDVIVEELRKLWKAVPDWRLGQLIVNCANSGQPCPTVFYKEDDDILEAIRSLKSRVSK